MHCGRILLYGNARILGTFGPPSPPKEDQGFEGKNTYSGTPYCAPVWLISYVNKQTINYKIMKSHLFPFSVSFLFFAVVRQKRLFHPAFMVSTAVD